MTPAARSIFVFGIYLEMVGAMILGAPDTFLRLFGQPAATDHWFRVLGVVVMAIGLLDIGSARTEQTGFFRASVRVRVFVLVAFAALVLFKIAPSILLLFGAIDAAGALWTWLSLRNLPVAEPKTT